jgi:hypothetical protein
MTGSFVVKRNPIVMSFRWALAGLKQICRSSDGVCEVIDQVGGRLHHTPPRPAGGAKPTLLTGERRRRRNNMDVAGQYKDVCFTGHEPLMGAVRATQPREGHGLVY